jgi:3-hydroxyacyl-CoA dehydrogenase
VIGGETQRAGVIGAGTMGTGIAAALSGAGIATTVVDPDVQALKRASHRLTALFASGVSKGRMDQAAMQARLALISFSLDPGSLAEADAVIEAAYEDLDLKRAIFARYGSICGDRVLLASNTSTLDIDAIGAKALHPERTLGMHFFSPAHVMKLVEIVRGSATSHAALAMARRLVERMQKVGVVVGNGDGFVGNRMLLRFRREAECLLEEGATPHQVDRALESFGFKLGPFAVSDLAGLDIAYLAKRERAKRGGVPFRQSRIPDILVEMARLGQKTGAGYYDYGAGGRDRRPADEAGAIVEAERRRLGITARPIDDTEIVERCLLALYGEGERVLSDGIASCADDIDTIWREGYGFPAGRRGPMSYGRSLSNARERIAELAGRDPAFWGAFSHLR